MQGPPCEILRRCRAWSGRPPPPSWRPVKKLTLEEEVVEKEMLDESTGFGINHSFDKSVSGNCGDNSRRKPASGHLN